MGVLGVLVLAVLAVLLATSGGGSNTPSPRPAGSHTTAAGTRASAAPAVAHGQVTVAVLNGTAVPGLASTVANTLAAAGFRRGVIANASDQQRSVTVVEYTGAHEPQALAVAQALGVPSDGVQPIDPDTQRVACQGAASCSATVVVTVGADRQK
jgi:LytR cell envelope-related transcriptional attenuator